MIFRYVFLFVDYFFELLGFVPPHPRRQCQSSLSGEQQYENNKFFNVFLRRFEIFGVLNGSPLTPITGVNVKVPFQG